MKKTLILLLIFFYHSTLKADGIPARHIKISIEDIKGKIIYCYARVWIDSTELLNNPSRLKKELTGPNYVSAETVDTIIYYTHRLKYIYKDSCISDKIPNKIMFLIGAKKIAVKDIKNVKLIGLFFPQGMTDILSDKFVPSDTVWMKIKPVRQLCYELPCGEYQVIIHRKSNKISALIKEIDIKRDELKLIDDYNSDNYYKVAKELEELIFKIHKEKYVVLISTLDC